MHARLHATTVAMATALVLIATGATAQTAAPSAATVVDQFQANNGVYPGFRRNHAAGTCVSGWFDSSGHAATVSTAEVFQRHLRTPVVGRFSIPGGKPHAMETGTPVRGLALAFLLPDGQSWRTAMLNAPVFQAATPTTFFALLKLQQPTRATGKPDAAQLATFFNSHPDTAPFRAWASSTKPSASYADQTYRSLNAYEFIDAHGARHAVRWRVVPATAASTMPATGDQPANLAADLAERLARGPLTWQLQVTLAEPGDPINDATRAWPENRRQIDAGTLVLTASAAQESGACRDLVFDPLMLPTGIQPSADPLLHFRSGVYQQSFERRVREEAGMPGTAPGH